MGRSIVNLRSMRIENGTLVSLDVAMYDAQGNLLERSEAPLVYLHGARDIFPRIEAALEGQEAGYAASVKLEPEEAFGDYHAEQVHLVDCKRLAKGIAVGMRVEGLPGDPDGRIYTVTDIAEGMALLDGNHPLAGWALCFELRVTAVERATEAELEAAARPLLPEFLRAVAPHEIQPGGDESPS
jgi:FKBP-type peptidyl-prolyl cis-trans isomerase SlyD